MTKSSSDKLKRDEKKVIKELQKNSKQGIEKIGKNCGFSRQKVWRILKKLEADKSVWGYNAVIDDEKAGVKRYLMLIKNSSPPSKEMIDKIINLTMEKKGKKINIEVESGGLLHGIYDWMIIFSADDYKEVNKFSEMFMLEYSNIIKKMDIIELIFPIKKYGLINPNLDKLSEYF